MTRVVLRLLASPLPLAFLALVGPAPSSTHPLGLVIALASARFVAVALYGGLALGLEDLQDKPVLPIGRRKEARRAFEGDLGEQVGPVESEAGVRQRL